MQRKPSHFWFVNPFTALRNARSAARLHWFDGRFYRKCVKHRSSHRKRGAAHEFFEIETPALLGERFPQVADFLYSLLHVAHVEVLHLDSMFHLVPRDGRGDGCERRGANGIHRRKRGTPPVLIVIDEHAPRRSFFFLYSAVISAGSCLAMPWAKVFANVHTCFCNGPRTIGTYTCMPFEPEVLA